MTDRIEKRFEVKALRTRVWRAIANAEEFGTWFGMTFDGPFAAGTTVIGRPTAKAYEHMLVKIQVERVQPETYFAYRWHPYPNDPKVDYSAEPTTLVEFRLEEAAGGTTRVTIVESGFDRLPSSRRAEAFRMNEAGWASQAKKLASHVG